jgi:hypothetical protein
VRVDLQRGAVMAGNHVPCAVVVIHPRPRWRRRRRRAGGAGVAAGAGGAGWAAGAGGAGGGGGGWVAVPHARRRRRRWHGWRLTVRRARPELPEPQLLPGQRGQVGGTGAAGRRRGGPQQARAVPAALPIRPRTSAEGARPASIAASRIAFVGVLQRLVRACDQFARPGARLRRPGRRDCSATRRVSAVAAASAAALFT